MKSCACFGGTVEDAVPLACALEMIHTYSLIHDDLPVMDDDSLRRGRATNHIIYGEAIALLAGDALLNLAYETMIARIPSGEPQRSRYLSAMARIAGAAGATGMVGGQCLDICPGDGNRGRAALAEMHRRKTGRLFTAAITAGALLAGAEAGQLACAEEYAEHMGLLFQIVDDLLDATGSAERMGKSTGKDEMAGKLTYVTLLGEEGARAAARQEAQAARRAAQRFDTQGFFTELIQDLQDRDR